MVTTKETPTHNSADAISPAPAHSTDVPPQRFEETIKFFNKVGVGQSIKEEYNVKDSFSNLADGILEVIYIERGKISCLLLVKAPVLNIHGGVHGGAVAAVAERVAIACARKAVGKDKDIFLGELSLSYLSAAPQNEYLCLHGLLSEIQVSSTQYVHPIDQIEVLKVCLASCFPCLVAFSKKKKTTRNFATRAELIADGSVIRSGRNLTVVAVDLRRKDSGLLVYMTRATFYNQPISSL